MYVGREIFKDSSEQNWQKAKFEEIGRITGEVSTIDESSKADSHWKVMIFMDEMPNIFERCDRNLPIHVRNSRMKRERKKSISTFVLLSSGFSMRYFANGFVA